MIGPIERLAYAVSQTARVGWYLGQYMVVQRLAQAERRRRGNVRDRPPPPNQSGAPRRPIETGDILAGLRELMARDLAHIEAGHYRLPHDMVEPPGKALGDAARFFRDLPAVARRRRERSVREVRRAPPEGASRLPRYYLQNFHYQTDGYLSDHSAQLYDHQVEVLFGGGADAMRRQALVPIFHHLRERGVAGARLLDLACGTGRFLTFVKDNYPRLDVTGIDLSPPYLAEARRRLAPWRGCHVVQGAAEAIPVPDGACDIVTCIYLFHELPRAIRAKAASEIARVLKPGGILAFVDSLQTGDRPDYDGLLERFPAGYHEPYYADYLRCDLPALFGGAGLELRNTGIAFMSKVLTFSKT